jgi:programmed cell death protein 5
MSSHNPNDDRNPSDAEISAMKDSALKTLLTAEAWLRLNNVRLVKPDLAAMVENYLLGLASQGRLNSQISDDQLKQILLSTQQPKRDFKINRK